MHSCATADVDTETKGQQKAFRIQIQICIFIIQNMYDKCKDFSMEFFGDSKETAYKGKNKKQLTLQ